jgi:hypothetical protein
MIDLYYIHDLNLISARLHGVDLDVEQRGAELERLLPGGEGARAALLSIENGLARLILHDWPQPHDPVVCQLRAAAALLVERMRRGSRSA